MKFAICNEMFGDRSFADTFSTIAKLGYTGVEIAPFTLRRTTNRSTFAKCRPSESSKCGRWPRTRGSRSSACTGCWRRPRASTSRAPTRRCGGARPSTCKLLAELCADLGGKVMVLGSPQAAEPAARRFVRRRRSVRRRSAARGDCRRACNSASRSPSSRSARPRATSCSPPTPAIRLAKMVDSPHCKLHLDVKAMSSEAKPIADIIRDSRDGWSTSTRTTRTCSAPAWATSTSGRSSPR